jgi:hypothetical protein
MVLEHRMAARDPLAADSEPAGLLARLLSERPMRETDPAGR